ncbi:hypothetical protein SLE2022_280950 [Rubroshorea leprosula]
MKRRDLFVDLFRACNSGKSATQLHSQILRTGFAYDSFFVTKLNSLYAKYTSIEEAYQLFDETPQRTVYLWNSMLRSYCREKQWKRTLLLFKHMLSDKFKLEQRPDNFTVSIVLKACAGLKWLKLGNMVHGYVKKDQKMVLDMFVGAELIELYSECGKMGEALKVFQEFPKPDVVLWTLMVTGYELNGYLEEAVTFFSRMVVKEGISPDPVTLISLVSACAQLRHGMLGNCVLGFVIRRGFETDISLTNSLLNLYAKSGSVKIAANLFKWMIEKDVVSWSSMIACYVCNEAEVKALVLFNEMINQGVEPNAITMVSGLQACALACNLEEGKKIHDLAAKKGFDTDVSVSTALIDMYMKCFSTDEAVDVFRKMPWKDVVCWAALLSGYAQNGMAYMSMGVFRDMLSNETQPDAVALVKILSASLELGILQQAICLHGYVIRSGFENNAFVGASLIELYSKCGSLCDAVKVFEGIFDKDVVIWSAMIAGYGMHGQGREALKLFDWMVKSSAANPNNVTFLSLLSACSHSGLIQEGINIFDIMVHEYKVDPSSEHCGILVDLLGRIGELDKAMDIIKQMPTPVQPHVWGALLGACRIHQNIEMGEVAAKNLFHLDPNHSGYYILLSNIYALSEKWVNMEKIRTSIREKGLKKMFGLSVIEIGNEVHSFVADDKFHPDCEQIYELLRQLEMKMRSGVKLFHDAEFYFGA